MFGEITGPRISSLENSAKKNRTRIKWVSELFISGSRRWDVNFMNHMFYPHDVEEIVKVRIRSSGEGNFIAWHHEKNSLFSIKSAYNLTPKLKTSRRIVGNQVEVSMGIGGFGMSYGRLMFLKRLDYFPGVQRLITWRAGLKELCTISLLWVCALFVGWKMKIHFIYGDLTKSESFAYGVEGSVENSKQRVFQFLGPDWMLILLDKLTPTVQEQILFMFCELGS